MSIVLLCSMELFAQEAAIASQAIQAGNYPSSQQGPNTLVLGTGTGLSYDSNALNSQPAVSNMQYMVYPQIGLNLARPRWNALISVIPGLSYSSANLPQYRGLSVTSGAAVQYQASPKLSLSFFNSLVSSTNPFDTLAAGSTVSTSGERLTPATPLDYLPKTNEYASISAAYNLNARTSATASASYNYLGYQHDPSLPALAQPFQQSNSAEISLGLRRSFGPRYSGGVQYAAQMLDAGAGQIKTTGQSVQYTLQFVPTSAIRISAMVGPEYTQSTYALLSGGGLAGGGLNQSVSGWSWVGAATVSWTKGKSQLLASASQLLSLGNQYQGNVRQDLLSLSLDRRLAHGVDVNVFGAYSTNSPIFLHELTPRFSNNYLSTGATVGKTFADRWLLKLTYWYLLQDRPSEVVGPYSGNHNRVAVSLSYSLSKPLSR